MKLSIKFNSKRNTWELRRRAIYGYRTILRNKNIIVLLRLIQRQMWLEEIERVYLRVNDKVLRTKSDIDKYIDSYDNIVLTTKNN